LVGAATTGSTAGHVIGSTSNCADCHTARNGDFETHDHSDSTYHKTGGSVSTDTTVKQGASDGSQEAGTPCSNCHRDKSGAATTLTTWDEIAYEHDLDGTKDGTGSCVTCHNATRDVCSDGGLCTQSGTTIQDVIAANGDPTNCIACHEAKVDSTSSDASHGTVDHVAQGYATGVSPCTATGCHDNGGGSIDDAYVSGSGGLHDINGGGCGTCHVAAAGSGPLNNYSGGGSPMGEDINYEGINSGAGGTCSTCHLTVTADVTEFHHKLRQAKNGNCTRCHTDPRAARGYKQIQQMSCRSCHVQMNGNQLEIVQYIVTPQGTSATGDDSGNTYTAITTGNGFDVNHVFPNNGSSNIDNYGICFECHGATGRTRVTSGNAYTSATQPLPYHALPAQGAADGTDEFIGGNGYLNNLNASGTGETFRVGRNAPNQFTGKDASVIGADYMWTAGRGRFNIGYAQHALVTKAAQGLAYEVNMGAAKATNQNIPAGVNFGYQYVHHASAPYAVPNFDAKCTFASGGCDDFTINVSTVADKGATLGFDITASQSQAASGCTTTTYYVIYGQQISSFAAGGTYQFRYRDAKADPDTKYYPYDQYNSDQAPPVNVISNCGGSASGTGVLR
jgi:hypothetical protein